MNSASDTSNPLKRVARVAIFNLLQQVSPCQAVNSFMAPCAAADAPCCQIAAAARAPNEFGV
jgi:hypothetical protein